MTWFSVTFSLPAPAMAASSHFQKGQSSFLSEMSSYFLPFSHALLLLILPVSALLHSSSLLYNNLQFSIPYGGLPRERRRAFQAEVKANASMCNPKLCVFEKLKRNFEKTTFVCPCNTADSIPGGRAISVLFTSSPRLIRTVPDS